MQTSSRAAAHRVCAGRLTRTHTSLAQYGRSPAYRRLSSLRSTEAISSYQQPNLSFSPPYLVLHSKHSPTSIRHFSTRTALLQNQTDKSQSTNSKDPRRSTSTSSKEQTESNADEAAGPKQNHGKQEGETADEHTNGQQKGDKEGGEEQEQQKKETPPPPPPHGDKSPWQVFTDTLKSEFQASKEWNEGTKQLASSANDFTQNEHLQRMRRGYEAASGAATSTTSKILKNTGSAIGQGAAWTWNTSPVKGLRAGAEVTGKGLERMTRPLRETEAYKSMSNVIDDGSSSRYGGWSEKEERRKRRENRDAEIFKKTGRDPSKAEKFEEDIMAGTNITVHKDAAWKEQWRSFRDSSKFMQGVFSMKSTYNESENPLISTARSISDRIAGFFAENETAMVIKKFREMDPNFQLEPFLQDMREYILPEVLDAYVKGDTEVLQQWLSAAQYQVYSALMHQYTTAGLKSDGKILDIRNVDVLSARLLDPGEIPVFILTCRTQEVHVYRNAKSGELAAGMEDRVQQVTYAIGVTRLPEDVNNPETRGWRLIELQKSGRDYI